jgi:stage II sporulation protein D
MTVPAPRNVRRRVTTALLATAAVVAPASPALAAASPAGTPHAATSQRANATADEVYRVPAKRVFTILGRGFGHGYGMSQWGAQHAAALGVPYEQILDFYYPSTTKDVAGNPWIKVALTGTGNGSTTVGYGASGSYRYQCSGDSSSSAYCDLVVDNTTGLHVTDAATGKSPTLTGATKWRVRATPDGLRLGGWVSGGWKQAPVGGQLALRGPVQFSGPEFVKVDYGSTQRDYRGIVSATWTSPSGTSPARMIRLDQLHLDDYVRGVVYRESEGSWGLAALETQAVAARSYSARYRHDSRAADLPYDICDSTYCQVFSGSRLYSGSSSTWLEPDPSDPAHDPVTQTADEIRSYGGLPLFAEFSASNGGWTAGGATYSTPKYDTWDDHSPDPYHRWTLTLSASYLESRFGLHRLDQLVVTQRDGTTAQWGGRVRALQLVGVDSAGNPKTVTLSDQTSARLGMRSSYWTVRTVTVGGAANASRETYAAVSGVGNPGSAVALYKRGQGESGYTKAKTVTIGSDGTYDSTLWVTSDTSYYATSDGATSDTKTVDVTGTTLRAPKTATLGSTAHVNGYAEPGSTVTLHLKRTGGSWHQAGTATAGPKGWYALSYVVDGDYTAYASAAGFDSPQRQTSGVLTLRGPGTAARRSTVTLTGHTEPNATATVYREMQYETSFSKADTVTADASGAFRYTYRATTDASYYAKSAGRVSAMATTRARGTTISGPASAKKGTWVHVTGYAAPGATVTLYLRPTTSTTWTTRPDTTAGPKGWWSRYFKATSSTTYYAVGGGYTSPTLTTAAS